MAQQKKAAVGPAGFRESRIYAQGWNAARASSEPARNPYKSEPDRSLWLQGYTKQKS